MHLANAMEVLQALESLNVEGKAGGTEGWGGEGEGGIEHAERRLSATVGQMSAELCHAASAAAIGPSRPPHRISADGAGGWRGWRACTLHTHTHMHRPIVHFNLARP